MNSDSAHEGLREVSGCEPFASHLSPLKMVGNLWNQRELITRFTWREIVGRYKGTSMGIVWSFISPLFLLLIYTLVFGVVLHSRWPESKTGSLAEFALTLFCGLIVFNVFQECMSAATLLIFRHPSYVKKVVFPLEIFSFSLVGSALFHALLSLCVLVSALFVINHELHWTLVWVPVVLFPLFMLVLGGCWLLSSLGVFFRDLQQFIVILLTASIFATPIFYSASALPPLGQWLMRFNPLAMMVEELRKVMLWGESPAWIRLGGWMLVSGVVMLVGYAVFMRTKRVFADFV
jgi:lipopolysaccharide transport system permease protein